MKRSFKCNHYQSYPSILSYFTSLFFLFQNTRFSNVHEKEVEEILIPICITKQEKRRLNKLKTNQSEL